MSRRRELAVRRPEAARQRARRIALMATLVLLGVYVAGAALADVLVLGHLSASLDGRLSSQLQLLVKTLPSNGDPARAIGSSVATVDPVVYDPDDAPIYSWWVPRHATRPVPLQAGEPRLVGAPPGARSATTAGDSTFRLVQAQLKKGRLIVGSSVAQLNDVRGTLFTIESVLLPLILVTFFFVAWLIGHNTAAPIERARQEQLDFTADASHELRTPLAVIEAEVGLALSAKRAASDYRASLERVAAESRRLRDIVADLLWLARLDALPEAPERELIDLAAVLSEAVSRFTPVAAARSVTIAGPPSPALGEAPLVSAPREWIERLVSVLVDNACRYTGEGGGVRLGTEVLAGRAALVVDDSGPGIAPDEREEVLRRFHRASSSPGGAGLGLSIADAIVRATGGELRISAAPAGGARVEVSWPHQRPADQRRLEPRRAEPRSRSAS